MVNRISRRLQHRHAIEARIDSISRRGQGSIKPRVDAGEYSGGLANNGNRLILVGPFLEPVFDFTYDDNWQPLADGFGALSGGARAP